MEEEKTSKKSNTYHISVNKDGLWQVKKVGAQKAIKIFKTQNEAISFSNNLAKNQNAGVLVHSPDGKISRGFSKNKNNTPNSYHVLLKDGKWQIKGTKSVKAVKTFDTKLEAVSYVKTLSKNQNSGVLIHKKTGEIQEGFSNRKDKLINRYHVLPSNNMWIIKKAKSKKAYAKFNTQDEAISYANELAKSKKIGLVIHESNGTIKKGASYKE
ncbi:DUF2188 domain-containing protein [Mycoplasma elephantis]|uniref:DUF2188 domain-containing protein n=1 Tax=Mycoplasma elephantis TaxID=114882 RepID=UPI000691135C|nr:DUF2188 domain-containing protein [Mycoplasma elephantis]